MLVQTSHRDSGGSATQVIEDEPTAWLPPAAQPPAHAPLEEPPADGDLWTWLLVLLVFVIAGLVGAWLATRQNSHGSSQGPPTAAALTVAPGPTIAGQPRLPSARDVTAARSSAAAVASVTVPDLSGEDFSDARKTIRENGLVAEVRRVPSSLEKNTVVAQSPPPGTTAKHGDHVLVTVSLGSKKGEKGEGHGNRS
jgi:PASTA domain